MEAGSVEDVGATKAEHNMKPSLWPKEARITERTAAAAYRTMMGRVAIAIYWCLRRLLEGDWAGSSDAVSFASVSEGVGKPLVGSFMVLVANETAKRRNRK